VENHGEHADCNGFAACRDRKGGRLLAQSAFLIRDA
jgi:hypothetical protein